MFVQVVRAVTVKEGLSLILFDVSWCVLYSHDDINVFQFEQSVSLYISDDFPSGRYSSVDCTACHFGLCDNS